MTLTVVWFITAIFGLVHSSPLISVKGKCLPDFQQFIVVYFKTSHFFSAAAVARIEIQLLEIEKAEKKGERSVRVRGFC